MRVAVLGGGFQGVCTALELGGRGVEVDLFDRNEALITQAGAINEGKLHLGYVYAADQTFATARTMIAGALAFAPAVRRWVGAELDKVAVSTRFHYLVHKHSMVEPDIVRRHFSEIARELAARADAARQDYFGVDLHVPHRELTVAECRRSFDVEAISTAIETREISVDPIGLAHILRREVEASPGIRVRLGATVIAAKPGDSEVEIAYRIQSEVTRERFDHAVNALWDGRLEIDRSARLESSVAQVYRCKYGLRLMSPERSPRVPSVTIVLGPFGDIVNFRNGELYLSWYPSCLGGLSTGAADVNWDLDPDPASASRVAKGTFEALSSLVPELGRMPRDAIERAIVRGGIIVARGESDIVDPRSGLHRRYQIGVESHGRYHSIDTGKYTMAPFFARQIADRLCGAC